MNSLKSVAPTDDLDNFIKFLFDGLEGYAYLVAKEPGVAESWNQEFFEYPGQAEFLARTIRTASPTFEVYLAPALYKSNENSRKENVKASNVVWTEFDGNAPSWEGFAGPPSLIIQSSNEGHDHVYWRLAEPITDVQALEDVNRRITYNLQADSSAWDATQVLRPPGTINHKRDGKRVFVKSDTDVSYDLDLFDNLAPAPDQVEPQLWTLAEIPDVSDVILRHSFSEDVVQLLKRDLSKINDRSASLMNLAYSCCQLGLADVEVFVMLRMADDRWGKFVGRRDRDRRLAHIISVARNKYPGTTNDSEVSEDSVFAFDYKTFLATEIELDWVLEGMLMEGGNMLMAGQSGVGKTQLSLQFMTHIAMGKDYLGYTVPTPKKILFLSLEMGHPDLQVFVKQQDLALSEPDRDILEQNLIIIPHGEAWPLNLPVGQERLLKLIEHLQPDGIFVDSIGSAILGNINSQEVVQQYTNFVDSVKKKYELFWWAIHHNRKAAPGQKTQGQDDVYGDQYLVNRASSVYGVSRAKDGLIRMSNFKNRLAPQEPTYLIERTEHLGFKRTSQEVTDQIANQLIIKDDINAPLGPFGL